MNNFEVMQMYNGLSVLRNNTNVRFPARVSFAIIHNIKILEPISQSYETARMDLVRRYGEEVADQPGAYQVRPSEVADFARELDALNKVENSITLVKIKITDVENVELSVGDMDALYPMLEEEG